MPLSRDDITRLIDIEAQLQNVPTGLARAVAYHESGFDPQIEGDGGNAIGLFQLHKGAAIDAGIDPKDRWDPAKNIFAGVRYLRQKLDQSGGKIDEALSRYNRGTPDYRGIGDPNYVQRVKRYYTPEGAQPSQTQPTEQQPQQPGILARMGQALSPASAEAATPQAAPRTRLEEIEAELDRREQQAAPQPPTATSTPEQDAAYKASRGQHGTTPSSQTPPPPSTQPRPQEPPQTPDTSWTPGMRFQALPSITQLEPADRAQKTKLFESLDPASQQEFLRSEEPASDVTVDIEKPSTPQPVTAPPPLTGPASSTRIEPLQPGASELALAEVNRPHEQGIPLSAVPGMAVNTLGTVLGAAAGSLLGPVGSAAGAAIGGSLANRGSTWMGLSPQEKPIIEGSVVNLYPSDLLGAIPLGIATGAAALRGTVRNLPGANVGRHEMAAERLEQLGQRTSPPVPSDVLWQKAGQSNTAIATADVWRTAGDVVRRKSRTPNLSADDPALKAAQDILNLTKQHGGPVPIHELDDARRNLVPHLRDPDIKRLYGSILDDMDNAVARGVPGAADLRGAIATTRKEHAHAELTDLWSPGKGMQYHEGDKTQIFGKRIRNQFENRMKEDKAFAGAFSKEELTDIRSTLRDVGKLTVITNPSSQGPLRWLGSLASVGYGASTGDFFTSGAAILASQGASTVLAHAMQSPVGRWALREAIREGNGRMTRGSLSAIAALLAREAAPEAPEPAPAQTP